LRNGPSSLAQRVIAVLALPAAAYMLLATGERALDSYWLGRQATALRAEIAELRRQNLALQEELNRRRTDAFIEETARSQLGLVQEGDQAVVIIGLEPSGSAARLGPRPSSAPSRPAAAERPPWRQWLDFFFGE
jgi:cell division protein FtsB